MGVSQASKAIPIGDQYRDFDWKGSPGACKEWVYCYAFADSPSGDGTQAVISDPLDKYMTKEQLWEALVRWRKVPMRTPATLEMEVTEEEDGTIVTKRILDLTKCAKGYDGLVRKVDTNNPVRICKCTIDQEAKLMTRSIFYGDGRSLAHNRDFVRLLDDPLIVEAWRIDISTGTREIDEDMKDFMEKILNKMVTMNGDAMEDIDDIDNVTDVGKSLSILCW
mmetsp:Transcript_113772/g.354396  ORF Transcript_113772/g.354396 Transcript_113772/m.354396 type:complete len:222 (-) Transcript_113772:41-706(-)